MSGRLTALIGVATVALAAAAFGGAYALGHGEPAAAAPDPRPPAEVTLANDQLPSIAEAGPLPALAPPRPAPRSLEPELEPGEEALDPVVPVTPVAPAPAPAPTPAPAPEPEPEPPINFDDSG